MEALLQALLRSRNPNLQDIGDIPQISPTLQDLHNALAGVAAGTAGLPVDLMTTAMRPFGYDEPRPVGGSEWMGEQLGADPESGAFIGGTFGSPDPMDGARLAQHFPDLISAMTVFHGSPHKWDKVDLSKVGTGEGAQAYGHGFYAAENPGVANTYAQLGTDAGRLGEQIAGEIMDDLNAAGVGIPMGIATEVGMYVRNTGGNLKEVAELLAERAKEAAREAPEAQYANQYRAVESAIRSRMERAGDKFDIPGSNLYELDLPDETIAKMLDWDKPLSEQPEAVRKAIQEYAANAEIDDFDSLALAAARGTHPRGGYDPTGKELYEEIADLAGSQQAASDHFKAFGIPGIRYLDGTSRTAGEGTRNFVVFDEQYITPLTRNGEPIAPDLQRAMDEAGRGNMGSVKPISRELRPDDVKTGQPVKFHYAHNTEKAPNFGSRYGQDIEPAGRYMSPAGEANKLDLPNMEYGYQEFSNPLVIDWGGEYGSPTNWKNVLSEKYGGLKGKKLTEALRKDGYDGIVTISESRNDKYVSEIVSLKR